MENLKSNLVKLESSIEDLRLLLGKQQFYSSSSNLIICCGAVLSSLSVFSMPKWVSFLLVICFSCYIIYDRAKFNSQIFSKLGLFHLIINAISESATNLQKIIEDKEQKISLLNNTINDISQLNEQKDKAETAETEKSLAELNFEELLKKIQLLDVVVQDFGPECTSYMQKEFSKALKVCGLEFADYTEENHLLFATERAAIDHVDCTARAIVTINSPKKIVLKGHAFIPKA